MKKTKLALFLKKIIKTIIYCDPLYAVYTKYNTAAHIIQFMLEVTLPQIVLKPGGQNKLMELKQQKQQQHEPIKAMIILKIFSEKFINP